MCRVLAYLGEPISLAARAVRDGQLARAPVLQPADDGDVPQPGRLRHGRLGPALGPHADDRSPTARRRCRPSTATCAAWPPSSRRRASSRTSAASPHGEHEMVAETNLHPFRFPGARVALAHNGHLREFARMRYDLVEHVRPELAQQHRGDDRLRVDLRARALAARGSATAMPEARELADADGRRAAPPARGPGAARDRHLVAGEPVPHHGRGAGRDALLVRLRLVPGRGRAARDRPAVRAASGTRSAASTCSATAARRWRPSDVPRSLLIASEPLTLDTSTWLEVPEYSMITAERTARRARLRDARPGCLTARDGVAFLATGPAARGHPARRSWRSSPRVMRRRDAAGGRRSCGARATRRTAMLLIVDGRVSVSLRLPGDRAVEVAERGAAARCSGEIPLLDGGAPLGDGARDRAGAACSRSAARTSPRSSRGATRRRSPSSGASPASPARACACSSPASRASLGGGRRRRAARAAVAELEFCGPPDSGYVRRLATFRAFDSLALWGFLTAGRFARCPAGPHAGRRGSAPRPPAT